MPPRLRNIQARYNSRYNPSSNQAHHDVNQLLRLITRYQALVQATLKHERDTSCERTRA